MSEATELTNKIIDYIYRQGGYAFRASSTGIYDSTAGKFRTAAKKGVSDVMGCFQGHLIAVEVKIGKDRLSDEQEGFLSNLERVGAHTFVAKTFDDFKIWFDGVVVLRQNSLCEGH